MKFELRIFQGLFAAANIFSSLKLVYIFSVNPYLGPLQVKLIINYVAFAVGKMTLNSPSLNKVWSDSKGPFFWDQHIFRNVADIEGIQKLSERILTLVPQTVLFKFLKGASQDLY